MKVEKFELNKESLKEFSVSWNNKDYKTAINLLVKDFKDMNEDISELGSFENIYYRIRIKEELCEITGSNDFPVADVLDIVAQEVLEVPIEERLSSFMSAVNINPDFAHEMFEKEIYPLLKSRRNELDHFLIKYIQEVLSTIVRDKNYRNLLLRAEDLVNMHIHDRKTIGSLQIQILHLHIEEGNFSEVIRMLKLYSNLSESKVAKARILRSLPYEQLKLEELEYGRVGIKEFIENQEENIVEILAPLIIRMKDYLGRKVLNYALHSHSEHQSPESGMKEFIKNYEKEYIHYNDSRLLVNTIYKALDIINDSELREEGYDLIKAVANWESSYQNEDLGVYKKLLLDLEEMHIEKILELAKNEASLIFKTFQEKGFSQEVPWNESTLLVENFVGNTTFQELKKYEEVMRFLKSGEWVFANYDKMLDESFLEDQGQDLTFILACHFKAVETFLYLKLWDVGKGQKFYLSKSREKFLVLGKKQHKAKYKRSTLGTYSYFFKEEESEKILKNPSESDRDRIFKYIQNWSFHVRNSNFHKDKIVSSKTVREFRFRTRDLLIDLVQDLI
ncbi:hypothetical protein [Planomicrobium okeanokoites]|uniref:hypothetical protein n=1 Tax=Planomicrobium okeanokoites TaxID=244 RepID=UPI0030FBC931